MSVATRDWTTQGAGVEDQTVAVFIPTAAHHCEAAIRKHAAPLRYRRRRCLDRLERLQGARAEKPHCVGCQLASGPRVGGRLEEYGGGGEGSPKVFGLALAQRQYPSIIPVTNARHRAVRLTQSEEKVEHRLHALANDGWHLDSRQRRENQKVEIGIHR